MAISFNTQGIPEYQVNNVWLVYLLKEQLKNVRSYSRCCGTPVKFFLQCCKTHDPSCWGVLVVKGFWNCFRQEKTPPTWTLPGASQDDWWITSHTGLVPLHQRGTVMKGRSSMQPPVGSEGQPTSLLGLCCVSASYSAQSLPPSLPTVVDLQSTRHWLSCIPISRLESLSWEPAGNRSF